MRSYQSDPKQPFSPLALPLVILATAFLNRPASIRASEPLRVAASTNSTRLMPYQVFELTFQHANQYADPTWDVTIDVDFTSPSGRQYRVGGFFYGSSRPQKPSLGKGPEPSVKVAVWPCEPADLWRARFAPDELGRWRYRFTFRSPDGRSAESGGDFTVVEGSVPQKGFLRIDPQNPFRFVFDDRSPYYPLGFQDGVFDNNANGSCLDDEAIEGPFRPDPKGERPVPPPGALFARGPSMGPINGDVTLGRHARAGFNLWRFSPNNYSIKVFAEPGNPRQPSLDHVLWNEAMLVDELLQAMRKYGMRNFYGIFGYTKVFNDQPDDAQGMEKVKRIIKYSVDRWGAYVDVWEMLNEQHAADGWFEKTVPYLRAIDPYKHPISTSWERPELAPIEINGPHWYGNEPELTSDLETARRAAAAKKYGKPVIYGEQGNYRGEKDRSAEGIGGVWDPGSARRMRVRCWTAMFQEVGFIFWETSYAKDGHVRNIWIGPEERQYLRVLQESAARLDGAVRMVDVHLGGGDAESVRAYGLRSPECAAVYLHHGRCRQCRADSGGQEHEHRWDHRRGEVRNVAVAIDVPRRLPACWIDPATGNILGQFVAEPGRQELAAPAFEIDLALLLSDRPLPDTDRDGKPNHEDEDDDGDGVADAQDAWPGEREEWADADGDRIGDNHDADLDSDGVADDRNGNGTPDNGEPDWDGDGYFNAGAVPWDAFPRDPREWRDTDGDGQGDHADADDDGDGYTDEEERAAKTDPLSPLSFP